MSEWVKDLLAGLCVVVFVAGVSTVTAVSAQLLKEHRIAETVRDGAASIFHQGGHQDR